VRRLQDFVEPALLLAALFSLPVLLFCFLDMLAHSVTRSTGVALLCLYVIAKADRIVDRDNAKKEKAQK